MQVLNQESDAIEFLFRKKILEAVRRWIGKREVRGWEWTDRTHLKLVA